MADRQYLAVLTVSGREFLVARGVFHTIPLTPKPNAGFSAARSVASQMDAWWPKGGASR